jgi:hypothetical protein
MAIVWQIIPEGISIPNSHLTSVSFGSLAAAHHNYLGVSYVPISASRDALFSVSFGGSRRSELISQGRLSAHNGHG